MKLAPVVVFAYNRVEKISRCLEALEKNVLVNKTDLFIFSDGAKNSADNEKIENVRYILQKYKSKSNFQKIEIIKQTQNIGLANSIIQGVSKVISEYGKVIVVEDDIIASRDFLLYMNQALDYYEDMKEYGSVSAYTYPLVELQGYDKDVFVTRKGECWGWGTWFDRWCGVDWEVSDFNYYFHNRKQRKEFDKVEKGLDRMLCEQQKGKIDSWAVRWCYHLFTHNLLTVYPRISKVINIGFDGSGTNCGDLGESEMFINKESSIVGISEIPEFVFERLPVNKKLESKAASYMHLSYIQKFTQKIKRGLVSGR